VGARRSWDFTIRVLDAYGETMREFCMIWADQETSIRRAKHLYEVWSSREGARGTRVEVRDLNGELVFYEEQTVQQAMR
jgi:hypothetical protein